MLIDIKRISIKNATPETIKLNGKYTFVVKFELESEYGWVGEVVFGEVWGEENEPHFISGELHDLDELNYIIFKTKSDFKKCLQFKWLEPDFVRIFSELELKDLYQNVILPIQRGELRA